MAKHRGKPLIGINSSIPLSSRKQRAIVTALSFSEHGISTDVPIENLEKLIISDITLDVITLFIVTCFCCRS